MKFVFDKDYQQSTTQQGSIPIGVINKPCRFSSRGKKGEDV
jgi:hypothetical protein